MRLKLKCVSVVVCLMFLTGCSIATQMVAPVGNFALGLYNADTYITKDCAWYEPVWFSAETKRYIEQLDPPSAFVKDIAKVARNNDLSKELCNGNINGRDEQADRKG
jgi:hypothetical protein